MKKEVATALQRIISRDILPQLEESEQKSQHPEEDMLVAAMANLLIAGLKELGRGRSWDLNQIQELRVWG